MASVGQWAEDTFGERAEELARILPACLARAHRRARSGQEGVRTQTLEAYGHGLHAVQFEELAAGLDGLGTPVRLLGRTMMTVQGHLLFPLRYAKSDVPVTEARLRSRTGFRAELIRRHGPEPLQLELDLGLEEPELPEPRLGLERLPEGTALVLVPYACSMTEGLIRAEWGSAELNRDDCFLTWHQHEPLCVGPDASA